MGEPGDLGAVIESIRSRTLAGKLRQLLPLIDERIKNGVSYQDIIEALRTHGGFKAELKASTLRSYLSRYRKRGSASRLDGALRQPTAAVPPQPAVPAVCTPTVRNASDLRRLRNQEIDLDALSRIGRNQGRK